MPTLHEPETITLIDGTEITIRPLKISLLRTFMKEFEKITEFTEDNDKSLNLLMKCVAIAFKQYAPDLSDDVKKLEDLLDLPTVYKVVEAASGVDLAAVGTGFNA